MELLRPAGKCISSRCCNVSCSDLSSTGLNERRCIARDVLGLYGSIITCAAYTHSDVSNEVPVDDFVKALKQCIIEHPVLCTVIQNAETERPELARSVSIDLNEHLRTLDPVPTGRDDGEAIQRLLEQAHNEPFLDRHLHPPWRLYILPLSSAATSKFRAAFSYSHAIADGKSGLLFHMSFSRALENMQNLSFDGTRTWEIPVLAKGLHPPLELAATLPISWSFLLRPLMKEFLPSIVTRALGVTTNDSGDRWCGALMRPERPAPLQLLRTAARLRSISHKVVRGVLAVCRKHNVRLTGLLELLTARALALLLSARGQQYHSYEVETAMDLRRCIPTATDSMTNFVSAVTDTITLPSNAPALGGLTDEDWITARRLTEHQAQASNTLADQPVTLLKYLTNIREWVQKKATQPSDLSFSVSNISIFDSRCTQQWDSSQSTWHVEDMVFSQSADATGAPFNLNVVSTKEGSLMIVLSWWPGMLGVDDEDNFVEEVCSSVVEQMSAIAQ